MLAPLAGPEAAKLQLDAWGSVNPKLRQRLVDANHDGLIQAGDEIVSLIVDLVEPARAKG